MTLKTEILSNFENVDKRVDKFIDKTISALTEQDTPINDYTKIILNLLVLQLILYYKACDQLVKDTDMTTTDAYKRRAKHPEITIIQKAHDQILNLLDKLTLSPLENAKVKKLKRSSDSDEDAKELLNKLIS